MKKFLLSSVAVFNRPNEGDQGGTTEDQQQTQHTTEDEGTDDQQQQTQQTKKTEETGEDGGDDQQQQTQQTTEEDWRDRQIGRQHRKLTEKDARIRALEQENADLKALRGESDQQQQTQQTTQPAKKVYTEEDVKAEAQRIASQDTLNRQLDDTYAAGKKAYGDKWDVALDKMDKVSKVDPQDMLSILSTDDPAKVLFQLGENPAEYQRILDLPPARRHTEYVKLSLKEGAKVQRPSKAPPPTEGLKTQQTVDTNARLYDEKISDDDWYKIRAAQKKERFARRQQQPSR